MPPFAYPSENITGVFGLFNHANNITNGALGIVLLIMVFVISFITTKPSSISKSVAFAMFLTLISAFLLRFMNLITDGVIYIVIILFVGIVVWLWFSKSEDINI